MSLRAYDPERDRAAIHRIWAECGWLEKDSPEDVPEKYVLGGQGWVAELDGQAECLVFTGPGDVQYLGERLDFCCVAGVTTSMVARKQGLAGRLTALALARHEGALVAGLGAFEHGYYDRLGFGTGSYEVWANADPSRLLVDERARPPLRLGKDDAERVHACRLARRRSHGSVSIHPVVATHEFWDWGPGLRVLGYADGPGGEVTHCFAFGADDKSHGPYRVFYFAFQTGAQFRELLALLKAMGDQVYTVNIPEPAGFQLEDFLPQPVRDYETAKGAKHERRMECHAWWQMRIMDLPGCMARTHLPGPTVRFNLRLEDPVARFLDAEEAWRGVGGEYVVALGPESSAATGTDAALPTLEATVGAFTRMWLGVRPATGLAVTDRLRGPAELLASLDEALRIPQPHVDWSF
jgi:hypothetical protein